MLAAILAIYNHATVDVVSSSPVLAKRDALGRKYFFILLELTVANCGDDEEAGEEEENRDEKTENSLAGGGRKKPEKCYVAIIIYSSIDILEGWWILLLKNTFFKLF